MSSYSSASRPTLSDLLSRAMRKTVRETETNSPPQHRGGPVTNKQGDTTMTTAINSYTTISISVDGVWAGSGKLIDGKIVDCGSQFSADHDESESVYELIEDAIEHGHQWADADLSDQDNLVHVTWSIV